MKYQTVLRARRPRYFLIFGILCSIFLLQAGWMMGVFDFGRISLESILKMRIVFMGEKLTDRIDMKERLIFMKDSGSRNWKNSDSGEDEN